MPHKARRRRLSVVLPDEVLPVGLTDPRLQAIRDKRWARKAAGGSFAILAMFGTVLAEIFQPSRAKVVAEQQQDQASAAKGVQFGEPEDGGGRFGGTVELR